MHISHIICMISYFAYLTYLHMQNLIFCFAIFFQKRDIVISNIKKQNSLMLTTSFTMNVHFTRTFEGTLVGNRTRDLRLFILTLYQLEQLSYVTAPNFVRVYACIYSIFCIFCIFCM